MALSFNLFYVLPLALGFLLLYVLDIKNSLIQKQDTLIPNSLRNNHLDNCKSRLEYTSYTRHKSSIRPSKSLVSRILQYEALHSACTEHIGNTSCKYVVYVPIAGLGNKIMALVSTFAYALLTNRVMYIARQENLDMLFCEPFPASSWLLDESMNQLATRNESIRLGNLIGHLPCNSNVSFPEVVFSELENRRSRNDVKFFCPEQQDLLAARVRWYLLHPANDVWEKTTRFYNAYLAEADTLVGIQMRVHAWAHNIGDPSIYAKDVYQCLTEQSILPKVAGKNDTKPLVYKRRKKVAVFLTSLSQRCFDVLRRIYINNDTVDGSYVTVYQPSHEGEQQTGNMEHDQKALMEICLLSLSDFLLTSPVSTFGYTAQGLMGVHSWQMLCKRRDPSRPICAKKSSMEPCYHTYPSEMMVDNVQVCECNVGFMLKAASSI